MSKAFKEAYEQASRLEESLYSLATKAGASDSGLNHTNAERAVDKALSRLNSYEERAKDLGYTSAAEALDALSRTKP